MEHSLTTDDLIRALSTRRRIITLGGVAVISHGLSRNTFDVDIWMEPLDTPGEWAEEIGSILYPTPAYRPVAMGTWNPILQSHLVDVISQDGVIRILGMERPLDIFRDPNELAMEQFDEVWSRARPLGDGTRLPDVIDLLVTKQDTGRDKDTQDIVFLEAKAEREYLQKLPNVDAAEAIWMLGRFLTPRVAELAMTHSDSAVRELAYTFLVELADEGNPYARDILQEHLKKLQK